MKRFQAACIGSKKKQAEVISEDDEELLWKMMKHYCGRRTCLVTVDYSVVGYHHFLK